MIRTKNFIVYLPSFAGHLLQTLFGTDPCVLPITNQILKKDSADTRITEYSFANTTFDGYAWAQFHDLHDLDRVSIETWLATDYPVAVEARHPSHLDNLVQHPEVEYKFFVVELSMSEFACYWTGNAREHWNNFPVIQHKDVVTLESIKSKYKYHTINLDCFLDKDQWEAEYIRVCALMNISPYLEQATILFNTWYDLRVKLQKERFSKLSTQERQTYVDNRINGYRVNPLRFLKNIQQWQAAYSDVKDPSWPECPTPEDYTKLPTRIQEELKNIFNIHPDMFIHKD